jgi:hypothetical protein
MTVMFTRTWDGDVIVPTSHVTTPPLWVHDAVPKTTAYEEKVEPAGIVSTRTTPVAVVPPTLTTSMI